MSSICLVQFITGSKAKMFIFCIFVKKKKKKKINTGERVHIIFFLQNYICSLSNQMFVFQTYI